MAFGIAERQARDGAYELLELARRAGVDRPVARVVRPRRDLVDEQALIVGNEHLDREQAHELEALSDRPGDRLRLMRDTGRELGRGEGGIEDVLLVPVLDRHVAAHRAVEPARHDDRDLHAEIDPRLENGRCSPDRAPRRLALPDRLDVRLALAVVAQAPRLEHGGRREVFERVAERGEGGDGRVGCDGDAEAAHEIFFQRPILADAQRIPAGAHGHPLGQPLDAVVGDVLELEGDDVDRLREGVELGSIVPAANGAGPARQRARRRASRWSESAMMPAAKSPALSAPVAPIASVPTGTPPGIWAIESRLSSPLSVRLSIGTPSTGRVVSEATMPGKWAAPPAPAMITARPRSRALSA